MDRAYSIDSDELRGARIVLHALHSARITPALATAGFSYPADQGLESLQRIELGSKFLVFRDMIKRSTFLDILFRMVVN